MRRFLVGLAATLMTGLSAQAAKAPAVGDAAPAFDLPSDHGGTVRLADFQHKKTVILAFYPKDRTSGCTKEMQAFSKDFDRFTAAGAAVYGISMDDVASHKDFAVTCALKVPLLSDTDGKVAVAYGAKMPVVAMAQRKTFVIDKQGIVRLIVDGMPDNEALLKAVKDLKGS